LQQVVATVQATKDQRLVVMEAQGVVLLVKTVALVVLVFLDKVLQVVLVKLHLVLLEAGVEQVVLA
jgi:hypothetical protein